MWDTEISNTHKPIGYRALLEIFNIKNVLPHYCWSYISPKWEKKVIYFEDQNLTLYIYPPNYQTDSNYFSHIEFALKNEGLNLSILKNTFIKIPEIEIVNYIKNHPTSKYARTIWFLYENLIKKRLDIPDLKKGNYFPILNSEKYYTGTPQRSNRHRIENNLLGPFDFCPMIRKTSLLNEYESKKLNIKADQLAKKYSPEIIARALQYLYTKETLSSWEIEREKPDKARLARFTNLFRKAEALGPLTKEVLINLQKEIVEPRFALNDYRDFQNYIGEEPGLNQIILHYIPPRPEDVENLMEGLLLSAENIFNSKCNGVIIATLLAFSFVFIHPFWDGNGRLHRFLIHYALSRSDFTPNGVIFPISAVILRELRQYDIALETFSKPLMNLIIDYDLNDSGEMTVNQNTLEFYQFIDFTPLAEYLFECVEQTILTDFEQELEFLTNYDKIKGAMKEIVDMPDQLIDLFIKCIRQNGGKLSERKKKTHFSMLTDVEIEKMTIIIAGHILPPID